MSDKPLAVTVGEPAGIGPELVIQLAQQTLPRPFVVFADADLLRARAALLKLPLNLQTYTPGMRLSAPQAGDLTVYPCALTTPSMPGQLDVNNVPFVLESLSQAANACLQQEFAAIVTGPVHKALINECDYSFTGQTEFLAQLCGPAVRPVMMLTGGQLRVALVTTHLALRDVADAVTGERLEQTITILHHDLQHRFAIADPKILVCGLNPHAGENGYLGDEEIKTIAPVIKYFQQQGMQITGPISADTAFVPKNIQGYHAILCMYHDQGLPVLKHHSFGQGINVTLGLPFIRTSVDHGTALDLAGTGKADVNSFISAFQLAEQMGEHSDLFR